MILFVTNADHDIGDRATVKIRRNLCFAVSYRRRGWIVFYILLNQSNDSIGYVKGIRELTRSNARGIAENDALISRTDVILFVDGSSDLWGLLGDEIDDSICLIAEFSRDAAYNNFLCFYMFCLFLERQNY